MGPNRTAGALLIGALARPGVGRCRIVHVPHAGSAGSRRTGHALRARLEGAIGAAALSRMHQAPSARASASAKASATHAAAARTIIRIVASSVGGWPRHHPNISQRTGRRIGHRRDDSATVAFLRHQFHGRKLSRSFIMTCNPHAVGEPPPPGGLRPGRWTDGVPSLYIVVTPKYFCPQNPEGNCPQCRLNPCCPGRFGTKFRSRTAMTQKPKPRPPKPPAPPPPEPLPPAA